MSDQLPDAAITAATENITAFLIGCGWTVAEAAEVAPSLADNVVAAAAPAIAARAAATERERIRQMALTGAKANRDSEHMYEHCAIVAATLADFADLLDGAQ